MRQPDGFRFDLAVPYPSVIIETIRQAVVQSLADIADAGGGVSDAYMLTDLLFGLIDQLFAATAAGDADRTQLRGDLAALAARVTALEPPPEASA